YGSGTPQTLPITYKSKGTTRRRTEVQRNQSTDVFLTDGLNGCDNRPGIAKTRESSVNIASQRVDYIPVLSLLAEYGSSNMNVQYGGTATVNGATADIVALSFQINNLPSGYDALKVTQHLYYVDRASGLVAKVQSQSDAGNPTATSVVESYFSDYRSVNG